MRRLVLAMFCLGALHSAHAATPVSGRDQHMLFARDQVQHVAAAAYQHKLAQLADAGMLDTDTAALARVRRVCAHLIPQAVRMKPEAAAWSWEVHVTSDPEVAAFSMAGGKLLVGTHFINDYRLTDAELAVALAHEMGHVIAEHVREQLSVAASFNPPPPHMTRTVTDVINSMESDISVYLRLQPLSRLQEMEADDIGVELAARAGTAPTAIKSFYRKIASADDGQSILDTHGSSRQRVIFVTNMANYAQASYNASLHQPLPVYTFR